VSVDKTNSNICTLDKINSSSQSDNLVLGLPFSVALIDFFRILPLLFQFRPVISPTAFLALITFLLHLLFFPVHYLDILCCSASISSFHPLSFLSSLSLRFLFWQSAISRSLPATSLAHNIWKSIQMQGLHWNTSLLDIPNRILQGLEAIPRSAQPTSPHNLFIFSQDLNRFLMN